MNAKKWSEHNWKGPLKTLGIRHRKFYATRRTSITETIKRGETPLPVAQYCGTSLAMIQADYCGTLGLRLDQTFFEPQAENPLKNMVAGPGFELTTVSTTKRLQELSTRKFEEWKRAKSA
jgi:hypothetical protein